MKKKVLAVAAATIMAATAVGALAGCGGNPDTTIKVFLLANSHESEFYDEYFEYMEGVLEKEFGVKYNIVGTYEQEGQYYTSLGSDITGGDVPDIFYLRPSQLRNYKADITSLQSFADEYGFTSDTTKRIADLNDVLDTALELYRFDPATGELGNPDDDLYAFPKDLSTQQLGYNRAFLERFTADIKAVLPNYEEPWVKDFSKGTYTWEDYLKICKAITDSSNRKNNEYACDVPDIEILTRAYGGELIDLSEGRAKGVIPEIAANTPIGKAIDYQARLVEAGAQASEGYANFSKGALGFYSLIGSWEISDHESKLGEGASLNGTTMKGWGVIPWPTVNGGTDWQGIIKSAGYVVSKNCAEKYPEKCEAVKYLALSFSSQDTQNWLVKDEKISLPLLKSMQADYVDHANDETYKPSTRSVFVDVVDGSHGDFSATYKTYDEQWLIVLTTELTAMYKENSKATSYFTATKMETLREQMQSKYDESKDRT